MIGWLMARDGAYVRVSLANPGAMARSNMLVFVPYVSLRPDSE
jgi:hypothetical protein